MSPIYEYKCDSCLCVTERIQTKMDGGPKTIPCRVCKDKAKKIISVGCFRMDGKMFTPGGPTAHDKDGGLGPITDDHQEQSAKEQSDYRQAQRIGKESDYVFGED